MLFTGRTQFGQDITIKGRGLTGIVFSELTVPQTEAVMVLGGDDHILHTRFFCIGNPPIGIEIIGDKVRREWNIFFRCDLTFVLNPFGIPANGFAVPLPSQC